MEIRLIHISGYVKKAGSGKGVHTKAISRSNLLLSLLPPWKNESPRSNHVAIATNRACPIDTTMRAIPRCALDILSLAWGTNEQTPLLIESLNER
jgi:hypothetical protein